MKFVAEAQATSQLEHPGIPPVHDIGVTPAGRVYFTMKLVRGRTLKEILKDLLLGVRAGEEGVDPPQAGDASWSGSRRPSTSRTRRA